jgi:hypothetical protein
MFVPVADILVYSHVGGRGYFLIREQYEQGVFTLKLGSNELSKLQTKCDIPRMFEKFFYP